MNRVHGADLISEVRGDSLRAAEVVKPSLGGRTTKMAGEKPNKRLLYSERATGRMYDMYEHPAIVDLFADGQGRILSGPQITKLEYFRTIEVAQEADGLVEAREVFLRLTMPTHAFLEVAGTALASVGENLRQMDTGATQLRETIIRAVKKVKDVELP
jgi:hypothetical protein